MRCLRRALSFFGFPDDRHPLAGSTNTNEWRISRMPGSLSRVAGRRRLGHTDRAQPQRTAPIKKQFPTIRWGTRYGAENLNRFNAVVARHTLAPFDFYCFTDDPKNVRPEVTCLPLPDLGCALPKNACGILGQVAALDYRSGGASRADAVHRS